MTGIIFIARLGSTRLNDKHLIEVHGKPFIEWLIDRFNTFFKESIHLRAVKLILATGNEPENRRLQETLKHCPVEVFFGSSDNIPSRLLQCATALKLEQLVCVDGDDLFCSPAAANSVLANLTKAETPLIVKSEGLPFGMNVMGMNVLALKAAEKKIRRSKLETGWGRVFHEVPTKTLPLGPGAGIADLRFTLDYPEDADFFKTTIGLLGVRVITISDADLIDFVKQRRLNEINQHLQDGYWKNFEREMQNEEQLQMVKLQEKLHHLIPGGAHTYSRGDDQFPENAPAIFLRGEGAYLWTHEEKRFLDYGMGLRSVNLGYANKEVAEAAYKEILKGNNLTRASITELQAAELLCEVIPGAEMVKFAKHGSTVTTAAVKLARAYTGKKYIAVPQEHPFFSFDDWFIGATVLERGIPEENRSLTLKFHYNDIASLEKLFLEYPGQIAAVILEPATTVSPCLPSCDGSQLGHCVKCPSNSQNFLHQVRDQCHKNGALFILDEMITGFRWHFNGAQTFYNVVPDLCTFGKAMANGFAVAALAGKREVMEIGGIRKEGAERVFLTSTTHGAEMGGLGAFIKTTEILERDGVIQHFWTYGSQLMSGINSISKEFGIEKYFYLEGYPCSPNYVAKDLEGNTSLSLRTLYSQEMTRQGVLMPYIALSYAHRETELDATLTACRNALNVYQQALDKGVSAYLKSRAIKPVFRQFN